jgi:hypothetical protein
LCHTNRPVVSRLKKQVHVRENHPYFLVFVNTRSGKRRRQAERLRDISPKSAKTCV